MMVGVLRRLQLLVSEDRAIVDHLRMIAFVTTASGKLQMPQELYDPRNAELVGLLDTNYFPSGNSFVTVS